MNVLFIAPYPPGEAASQRFRFEQYLDILTQAGIQWKISPFLDKAAWKILYKPGHFFAKAGALFRGLFRRIADVFALGRYDVVFIHREAAPFGPPVFEWIAKKIFGKKIIYDFDDAIWIPNASESNSRLTMMIKRFKNAETVCRLANVVSVGNKFLAQWAGKHNANVVVVPTTIDTDKLHNSVKEHGTGRVTIGWTGSHSTVQYLDELYPVLEKLEKNYNFTFLVICDVPPRFKLKSLEFVRWTKEKEITDLLKVNVGIMPLPDDIWAKGKCAFKALQYMALGIPAVVSDVGMNAEVVDHGVNGFVCRTQDDWYQCLEKLLATPDFLKEMSLHTRRKIVDNYSVKSNRQNFIQLFNTALTGT